MESERRDKGISSPLGRAKIVDALRSLLAEKEFTAITWSDIAQTAGVNEGLIYKYFKNKRNLLHISLQESLEYYLTKLDTDLKGIVGALNKLRKLIWTTIYFYAQDRVVAKILLLEVRNFPGYFESGTYQLVKHYGDRILEIIKEGINQGEIREDISPWHLMQAILGSIEHMCLPGIIFDRPISPDEYTKEICEILFRNIGKRPA
jgi:AcrR family transcriptional regulator